MTDSHYDQQYYVVVKSLFLALILTLGSGNDHNSHCKLNASIPNYEVRARRTVNQYRRSLLLILGFPLDY